MLLLGQAVLLIASAPSVLRAPESDAVSQPRSGLHYELGTTYHFRYQLHPIPQLSFM